MVMFTDAREMNPAGGADNPASPHHSEPKGFLRKVFTPSFEHVSVGHVCQHAEKYEKGGGGHAIHGDRSGQI